MAPWMKLFALAVTASVATAFTPSVSRVQQRVSTSTRLFETVSPPGSVDSKADPENPYESHTLEEVLGEAAAGFHAIVKHGYPEKNIPPLDPFNVGTISQKLEKDRIDVTFTLNDAVLKGLDTISLTSAPSVDFKELSVSLAFNIKELELSTDDYDREGTFKGLFKEYDASKFDRELTIKLSDISVKLCLDLDFSDLYKPTVKVLDDASELEVGKLKTDLEGSFLFDLIAPILKNFVTSSIAKQVKGAMETVLTDKLQGVVASQKDWIEKFNKIYKMKQEQGLLVDSDGNELKPRFLSGLEGVGQAALPMFWEVTSVPVDKMDTISIPEIIKTAKTGDLLLCSGTPPGAKMIRRWTQSPYSHVIMIVKEDNMQDGKTIMTQAAGMVSYDLLREKRGNGLQLNDIATWWEDYKKLWVYDKEEKATVTYRRLNREPRSEEEEKKYSDALAKFITEKNGIEYAEKWTMEPLFIMGLAEVDLEEQEGRTYYCASYVADAFMEWGLIDTKFMSQQYSPRDFSQKYDTLPFVDPNTSYGPEIVVEFD